ncbi:MAG: carboxypeptidase-like regulatory domain-containing protein [Bryobacteraceae bacterium]
MIRLCIFLLATKSVAFSATLTGRAVDIGNSGSAIPFVKVIVEKNGKLLPQLASRPIFTGKDGTYTITQLPAGEVLVRFEKVAYNPKAGQKLELKEPAVSLNAEMWRADGDTAYQQKVALYRAAKEQIGATWFAAKKPDSLAGVLGTLSDAASGKAVAYPTLSQFEDAGLNAIALRALLNDGKLWNDQHSVTLIKIKFGF